MVEFPTIEHTQPSLGLSGGQNWLAKELLQKKQLKKIYLNGKLTVAVMQKATLVA